MNYTVNGTATGDNVLKPAAEVTIPEFLIKDLFFILIKLPVLLEMYK